MLFRPKFCANCGVTVERSEWYPWTSRRFCAVCEIEFKGNELIPRAIFLAGVLLGIVGLVSLLGSATKKADTRVVRGDVRVVGDEVAARPFAASEPLANRVGPLPATTPPPQLAVNARPLAAMAPPIAAKAPDRLDERPTYCGAETRKGTACMRRVKTGGRCFQHEGMPAMQSGSQDDRAKK